MSSTISVRIGTVVRYSQWRTEAVGCPGPTRFLDALENILYSSRKISDDLFSRSPKCFTFSHQLSNFKRIRSLDAPPSAASCPGNDIFYFFFYICLRKLAPWMPSRVNARGRRTVRTPSARHWVFIFCKQMRDWSVDIATTVGKFIPQIYFRRDVTFS